MISDSNGDGRMTFAEWRDSPVRTTLNDEDDVLLAVFWAKFDTANVGYLTEYEAVNRKGRLIDPLLMSQLEEQY